MRLLPSEDGFLTQLQETGAAWATISARDDLREVVRRLEARAAELGLADDEFRVVSNGPWRLTLEVVR